MPVESLWSYLKGYVIIKVKGTAVEDFLTEAAYSDIWLWEVQRSGSDLLLCRLLAEDFVRLRALARSTRAQITIDKKIGLPFILQRIWYRRMLLFGTFFLLGIWTVVSAHIWFIDIIGSETVQIDEIFKTLNSLGYKVGMRSDNIDQAGLEMELLKKYPDIAWVGVRVRGTLVEIEIVEKVLPEKTEETTELLVAGKDGLIHNLIVFEGTSQVQVGNVVKKGDILIIPEIGEDGVIKRHPQATVKARVWYEGIGIASPEDFRYIQTGRVYRVVFMSIGDKTIYLGRESPKFEEYIEKERKTFFPDTMISFTMILYAEVEDVPEYGIERAREIAHQEAFEGIIKQLPEIVQVLKRTSEVREGRDDDGKHWIEYRVLIETLEDVAVYSQ